MIAPPGVAADLAGHGAHVSRVAVAEGDQEIAIGEADQHLAGDALGPGGHQVRQEDARGGVAIICFAGDHGFVAQPVGLIAPVGGAPAQVFQGVLVDHVEGGFRPVHHFGHHILVYVSAVVWEVEDIGDDQAGDEGSVGQRCRAALAKLLSLEAPVADWEEMEEELIREAV